MILKFFDIFLKMKDLSSSEAFMVGQIITSVFSSSIILAGGGAEGGSYPWFI